MEIIYNGGCDKQKKVWWKDSFWSKYLKEIQKMLSEGKRVALVILAKIDDHKFDNRIVEYGIEEVDLINARRLKVNWSSYDAVLLLGGDQKLLHDRLVERNFSLDILKEDVFLLGDSAGAMVLGKRVFIGEKDMKLKLIEGFNSHADFVVLPHVDNKRYVSESLLLKLEGICKSKGLELLKLEEGEEFKFRYENK